MADFNINVKKASGEIETFSEEKVRSSLQRAGANDDLINQIVNQIKLQLYEGIPTRKIYRQIFALLKKENLPIWQKYNLKEAIMALGPSGYPFEKFVAGILAHYDYQTQINQIIQGKCVSHEIDIVVQKDNQRLMVECKFHNRAGLKTDIKVALYTYARYLDVSQNAQFTGAWLITNTKVTSEAVDYARCVGLKITSWDYPDEASLRLLINKSGLHPITCLNNLSPAELNRLLQEGTVFCHDLEHK
jgi:hypothetical protein